MTKPLAQKKFKLTPREKCVAALYAQGASRKKIASKLSCSVSNVEKLSRLIRAKIGAENQTEAVYILFHYRFS